MAHECPECGCTCHCHGDIDDICFGIPEHYCKCCEEKEDKELHDDYEEEMQERDEQRMRECKCGGYQTGADGKIIMVADCVC